MTLSKAACFAAIVLGLAALCLGCNQSKLSEATKTSGDKQNLVEESGGESDSGPSTSDQPNSIGKTDEFSNNWEFFKQRINNYKDFRKGNEIHED